MSERKLKPGAYFTNAYGETVVARNESSRRNSFIETSDFILERFLDLPWPAIQRVLAALPEKYIYYVFLEVPSLRRLVADAYYSDIIFAFTGDLDSQEEKRKSPNDGYGYFELLPLNTVFGSRRCLLFLKKNADIVPRRAKVCFNSSLVQDVLESHRSYFMQIPHLQVDVHDYGGEGDFSLDVLQKYPNLKHLQLQLHSEPDWVLKLYKLKPSPDDLSKILNSLPDDAMLDTSLVDLSDKETLENITIICTAPESLVRICLPNSLNQVTIKECSHGNRKARRNFQTSNQGKAPIGGLKLPIFLRSLVITDCDIPMLSLSELPASLQSLTLTKSKLRNIRLDRGGRWPAGLESLDLSDNILNNTSIQSLSIAGLPKGLRVLKLRNNRFDLCHLRRLPDGLKALNLSDNREMTMEDFNNESSYPFYRFPKGLEILDISECRLVSPGVLPNLVERMWFPSSLLELRMDGLEGSFLRNLHFPASLRTLSIKNFGIQDLNDYECGAARDPDIAWGALKNLRHLSLQENYLDTLEGWNPPPNLLSIDLSVNMFSELSPNWPLFSEEYLKRGLWSINLNDNEIKAVNATVQHRLSLRNVNVSANDGMCTMRYEMLSGIYS